MCGFSGYLDIDDNKTPSDVIKRMTDVIKHRGPDDEEYDQDGNYVVGFRRLSIIDLAGGRQPMRNEDGNLILVFNGEIYNYQGIKEELLAKGHIFATNSDSEVLLHGYEEYGTAMFDKLRGMFAFVIYDCQKQEIFAARDFFGIKPFYYAITNSAFLFGSELKSLLEHPSFEKKLNHTALENYLSFQYSPVPQTFFEGACKLAPGHWLRYAPGMEQPQIERYWIAEFNAEEEPPLDYWVDQIEQTFDDSIAAHKISDVEVGSFLSSGVDSSYVACSANVDKTFTVGFDNGQKYNEIDYARELSELIPVKNIAKIITPEEFWGNFKKIQWHMDEPLADASAVALYFVSREAAKYLKVVLSGEGADEIFGGYQIYGEPLSVPAYDKVPYFIRRAAGAIAEKLPAKRGLNFIVRRSRRVEDKFIGNANIFSVKERNKLLKGGGTAPSQYAMVRPWYNMVKDKDDVTKMQFVDINTWLIGDILLKADKMSMANSLELRVPFLDKQIMALGSRLPLKYRVNSENTKYAMRLAAGRRMPKKWSTKEKLGFPVPIRVWLKEDKYVAKVREAFSSSVAEQYFNTAELQKLVDRHIAGKVDNSRKIWTVYTFLVWHDAYF